MGHVNFNLIFEQLKFKLQLLYKEKRRNNMNLVKKCVFCCFCYLIDCYEEAIYSIPFFGSSLIDLKSVWVVPGILNNSTKFSVPKTEAFIVV